MVQILNGQIIKEDLTRNAKGGTEIIAEEMVKRLDPELLQNFQIIHSRIPDLDFSKKRIFVAHDLPHDPSSAPLANGGYNKFDKLVFVSNWQMQAYINHFGIPWYKCLVMQNAINPLQKREPKDDMVRVIYHTTPHRGLNILANAISNIHVNDKNVHLDVYSSFKIYGWEDRDEQFKDLFDFLKSNPDYITYHGSVSNDEVKAALSNSDIFAYPSIWPETSCISLLEAMSAGLLCIHPNFAALPETASNWTWMYQMQDDPREHTKLFTSILENGIEQVRNKSIENRLENQKTYTDMFYNWDLRAFQWDQLLRSMI